jgi:hypothetical protein
VGLHPLLVALPHPAEALLLLPDPHLLSVEVVHHLLLVALPLLVGEVPHLLLVVLPLLVGEDRHHLLA